MGNKDFGGCEKGLTAKAVESLFLFDDISAMSRSQMEDEIRYLRTNLSVWRKRAFEQQDKRVQNVIESIAASQRNLVLGTLGDPDRPWDEVSG